MVDSPVIPVGVKVIASWYFVGAAMFFFLVLLFLGLADGVSIASSATSVLAVTGDAGVVGAGGQYTVTDTGFVGNDSSGASFDPQGFDQNAFTNDVSSQVGQSLVTSLLTGLTGSLPGVVVFVSLAVVCLFLSVLQFFVGLGLWTGKAWARVAAIIFALLGVLSGAFSLFVGAFVGAFWSGGFMLAVYALMAGYLLFNKGVSDAFAS